MRKKAQEMTLDEKRQHVLNRLNDLCRRYGTVKVAKLDSEDRKETLVLESPPVMVPGNVPYIPVVVLDPGLYRLMVEAYGSAKVAAAIFQTQGSLHFTKSEQGVE